MSRLRPCRVVDRQLEEERPGVSSRGECRGRRHGNFGQDVPIGFGGFLVSSPEIVVENPQAVEEAQAAAPEEGVAANAFGVDGPVAV